MPKNPAAQALIDTKTATRKQQAQLARAAELQECQEKLVALLAEYDAMLITLRIQTVAGDGTVRYRDQISVESRPQ